MKVSHLIAVFTVIMALPTSALDDPVREGNEDLPALVVRHDAYLTTVLDEVLEILSEVQGFLTPDFLGDVQSIIIDLATLLPEPSPNDTRALVSDAAGLISNVGPLLQDVEPLITELSTINFTGLQVLISEASSLIPGVDPLLSNFTALFSEVESFVGKLTGIASTVSLLLTSSSIATIGTLWSHANDLLATHFVNETSSLVGEVGPLIELISLLFSALL